jgi:hypothetical protein
MLLLLLSQADGLDNKQHNGLEKVLKRWKNKDGIL